MGPGKGLPRSQVPVSARLIVQWLWHGIKAQETTKTGTPVPIDRQPQGNAVDPGRRRGD